MGEDGLRPQLIGAVDGSRASDSLMMAVFGPSFREYKIVHAIPAVDMGSLGGIPCLPRADQAEILLQMPACGIYVCPIYPSRAILDIEA